MISVIIPVYNVEKYLVKCIESVIKQTYKDLEIILVDDGSIDGSGRICDQYAKYDERIVVIHKQNGGLSSARNAGLEVAKGDYIGFVDSDDFIAENMYEYLYNIISDRNVDMAICGFKVVQENDYNSEDVDNDLELIQVLQGEDTYNLVTKLRTEDIVVWNKLYRRCIFDNLRFKTGVLHEDQWIIPYIAQRCERVAKSNRRLYYYLTRKGTITKSKVTPKRMWDLLDALDNTCVFFKQERCFGKQKIEARHLCNFIIDYYERADIDFSNARVIRRQLYRYFKKVMKFNDNVFSYKQVIYHLFLINPYLGIYIKKMREKA